MVSVFRGRAEFLRGDDDAEADRRYSLLMVVGVRPGNRDCRIPVFGFADRTGGYGAKRKGDRGRRW